MFIKKQKILFKLLNLGDNFNMIVTKNGTLNPLYVIGIIKKIEKNPENNDEIIIYINPYNIHRKILKKIEKIYMTQKDFNNFESKLLVDNLCIFSGFLESICLVRNSYKIKIKKIKVFENWENSKNLDIEIINIINDNF